MLSADDAGIISRSPDGLEKIMTVIVTACAAFGLTVSEAKTEIMCLQTKGGGHVPFTVTAAGQVYKQTVEFVYLGGAISADWDLRSVEVTRRIQRAWACFGRYKMEIYDRPSVRSRLKVWMLKAEVLETLLYGYVTWNPSKSTGYGRPTTRCSSDASAGGNESSKTTSCPMPTYFSGQIPRALRRRYADERYCSRASWHAWEKSAYRGG